MITISIVFTVFLDLAAIAQSQVVVYSSLSTKLQHSTNRPRIAEKLVTSDWSLNTERYLTTNPPLIRDQYGITGLPLSTNPPLSQNQEIKGVKLQSLDPTGYYYTF